MLEENQPSCPHVSCLHASFNSFFFTLGELAAHALGIPLADVLHQPALHGSTPEKSERLLAGSSFGLKLGVLPEKSGMRSSSRLRTFLLTHLKTLALNLRLAVKKREQVLPNCGKCGSDHRIISFSS